MHFVLTFCKFLHSAHWFKSEEIIKNSAINAPCFNSSARITLSLAKRGYIYVYQLFINAKTK